MLLSAEATRLVARLPRLQTLVPTALHHVGNYLRAMHLAVNLLLLANVILQFLLRTRSYLWPRSRLPTLRPQNLLIPEVGPRSDLILTQYAVPDHASACLSQLVLRLV